MIPSIRSSNHKLFGSAPVGSTSTSTITPSISTNQGSRTMAPLAVHFDASGTTDSQATFPFFDLVYIWSFGDSGSRSSSYGVSHHTGLNAAWGPVVGHVFESAGNYTVTLTVWNPVTGDVATTTTSVNGVSDTWTTVVECSTSGTFSGTADTEVTTSSLGTAATYLAANTKVLLRGGETFTGTADIEVAGPWFFGSDGAYGIGNADTTGGFQVGSGTASPVGDGRVVGFDATGSGGTCVSSSGPQQDMLIMDCVITGYASGISAAAYESIIDYWNDPGRLNGTCPVFDGWCIAFNRVHTITDYNLYVDGDRLSVIGNEILGTRNQHVSRCGYMQKGYVANNDWYRGRAGGHVIKWQGPIWAGTATFAAGTYSEYNNWFANNIPYDASAGEAFPVAIGPQNSSSDERVRYLIWDSNYHEGNGNWNNILWLMGCYDSVFRNNLTMTSDAGGSQYVFDAPCHSNCFHHAQGLRFRITASPAPRVNSHISRWSPVRDC